jgi:hypothetical protein
MGQPMATPGRRGSSVKQADMKLSTNKTRDFTRVSCKEIKPETILQRRLTLDSEREKKKARHEAKGKGGCRCRIALRRDDWSRRRSR